MALQTSEAGMPQRLTGVGGLAAQSRANFTRANEQEADRIGMQVLARAGYDPRGMPSLSLKNYNSLSRYYSKCGARIRAHTSANNISNC